MDSLTVLHNVPVKVIMTETFRAQFVEQVRSSLAELDQESARLNEFLQQASEVEFRQRLEYEMQRLAQQRQQLEWRIREAESVQMGAELNFQTLPVMVQLKVGENLQEKLGIEVLLKDWTIVEFRGGTA